MRGKGRLVHGALETLTHTTQQVTTHSSEPHPQASGVVPSSHTMRWLLAVSCLSLSRASVPIPTSPITAAPETRAPPTVVPRAPCEALSSPPLVATIKAPVQAEYVECWTFQCVGTVEVTFSNISTSRNGGRVSLQNSDGYVLTSLVDDRERYIATYPANGEMTVVFNDTGGRSNYRENKITFEWVCNTGPAVVPAAGFDASTYLTLPPAGTYERMFSEQTISSWLIPCTGMLDIAVSSPSQYSNGEFIFTNSNGTVLRTDRYSFTFNGIFSVAGNFNITLHNRYQDSEDSKFTFAWSCGGTRPDLPSHDLTPAPDTRAPPTVVPRVACEALLSPPLVATIKAPVQAEYVECWTFQCVGTVEVTFSNISTSRNGGRVSLQNSDGYVLTSLVDNRERYIATYPANGEMTVVFNDTGGRSNYRENKITFEWVCHTGPAVVPAAGFDASTYLTLPPAGTYERMFSEQTISSWLIPCTGMLDIAVSSPSQYSNGEFIFTNSNGTVLRTDRYSFTFNGSFSVAGNFNITLHNRYQDSEDSKFTFAWSCGGTRPDLPSHDLTPAPETRAPPTVVPRAPCEALSSPPLVATIKAPVQAEYVECWTFQCVGTVEVTFSNISTSRNGGRVSLQNSDGYVLTSLVDDRERYIATYPANGEMTVVFNDTGGRSNYRENKITFEWVCHTGPAVVPAAGLDASTYLTLPPAGTYERMFSEQAVYSWLIPCTGMLDIAVSSPSQYSNGEFIFTNSNGTVLRTDRYSFTFNGSFSVAGNFNITLLNRYQDSEDSKFVFTWSCGGAVAATYSPLTPLPTAAPMVPATAAPVTLVPFTIVGVTMAPETAAPGSVPGSTMAPNTVAPGRVPGSTMVPNTAAPGSVPGSTMAPNTVAPGSVPGSTMAPETAAPGRVPGSTMVPNTAAPGSVPGSTMVPDTAAPGSVPGSTMAPNTVAPGRVPGSTMVPNTAAPGSVPGSTMAPNTVAPGSVPGSTMAPETAAPGRVPGSTMVPNTAAPGSVPGSTMAPNTVAPGRVPGSTMVPNTAAPGSVPGSTMAPDTAAPGSVPGSTMAPETVAPGSVPGSTMVPNTVAPGRVPGSTMVPNTAAPGSVPGSTMAPNTVAPGRVPGSTMVPNTAAPGSVPGSTMVPNTAAPGSVPGSTMAPETVAPGSVPGSTMVPNTAAPGSVPGSTMAPETVAPGSVPGSTMAPNTVAPDSVPGSTMVPDTAAPTLVPSSAPMSPAPDTATPTNLPAGASYAPRTSAPDTALPTTTPTPAPDTAVPTNLPAGASHVPGTSAPDTALPTATPTDQPAGATFAPSAPAVKALCTADKDCRSGRLDPKATCNAGTCVCHTQGYVHPTGVPLCLLADDVTVPMAFAVEYYGVEAGSLWTTATTRESFEETMSEALGIVTDMRVVVSDGGVLVVGMVRASTAKLADALSGKVDLSAALSSDGVSVSHGVTCARTDASYTVQHNGVCDAVECEGNTTLTLTDGTHTCEREAAPLQPEESGGSSNVVLYVGIGVGVLVVAVCVVAAFCRLQKKQRVKEFENPLFEMSREDAELYPTVEEVQADTAEELTLL